MADQLTMTLIQHLLKMTLILFDNLAIQFLLYNLKDLLKIGVCVTFDLRTGLIYKCWVQLHCENKL